MKRLLCVLSLLLLTLACTPLAGQIGNATWATPVPKNFEEPAWWDQGVVFVGDWEPLVFRLRHSSELPVDIAERLSVVRTESAARSDVT